MDASDLKPQMMYRGQPCLPYFSSVVKNVASPNIEVKKLVYIYLLHYAEMEPDLALLSINAIQKSLTDQNPQIRAMALRTMSGIRVPVISQIVSLAIKRGCGDMSPHVRKAAALAIPKCYSLDPNTLPQLLDYLSILLGDKQYFVVGSAVSSFLEICPDRIDLIHKHYRSLIRKLVDMDEWGQLATLRLMLTYSRKCFPRRHQRLRTTTGKGFYEDEKAEKEQFGKEELVLDPDQELLLKACKPLLQSRNSAVVVSVVRCYLHLGSTEYLEAAIGPLVALLRSSQDVQQIALYNIVSVALVSPQSFSKYASHFFISTSDPPTVWRLKMEILTLVFPHCGLHLKGIVLNELEHFSRSHDQELVRDSVRAIGRCAQNDTRTSTRCLKILLNQVSSPDGNLVSEALTVIRHLIQQQPSAHTGTVIRLAKSLDTITSPEARATIIWLVGEFAGVDPENNIAPDVLRILAKAFSDESEPAKQQIVLLAAKVYLHHLQSIANDASTASEPPKSGDDDLQANGHTSSVYLSDEDEKHPISVLWRYILLLTRYDISYDLRDRARLLKALLAAPTSTQLASLLLLAPKPVPHTPSPSETRRGLLLGSSTLIIGPEAGPDGLPGYEELPDWVVEGQEPEANLREESAKAEYGEVDKGDIPASRMLDQAVRAQAGKGNPGTEPDVKAKTLDDWLDEGGNEESEETEEESTETESEEESEDEEDSEEESQEEGAGEGQNLVRS